ncbi:MAG: septum formation initiator family protein [Ruminococcaceae bacterium]|nr:septum formation initiator family protein [Oscillospiraceae bacterium]
MADIHDFLNRFQLQYRRTPALHKVVVAAAIVLSSVTLISLRLGHWEAEEKLAALQHQAAVLEQQNEELRQDIEALGTADSIREIAREELGLVDPDTIIFEQAD